MRTELPLFSAHVYFLNMETYFRRYSGIQMGKAVFWIYINEVKTNGK